MMEHSAWIKWAMELQALGQAGEAYTDNAFDRSLQAHPADRGGDDGRGRRGKAERWKRCPSETG